MTRTLRLFTALSALAFAGCLGDDPVAPEIATTTFASTLGVNLGASTRTQSGLYYRDVTVGTGALAQLRSRVSVDYALWLPDGRLIEQSDEELDFTVGLGDLDDLIPGFEEGTLGMRVGGIRQVIIPPHLGYGSSPNGAIPGNSILVFTIELVSASGGTGGT